MGRLVAVLLPLSAVVLLSDAARAAPAPYAPAPLTLSTPWTGQVSRTAPLPEHPRPQLRREAWRSLNGQWQFQALAASDPAPLGRDLAQTILVPFPTTAPLSGIGRDLRRMAYRRFFTVPRGWSGRKVVLRFGAVTHAATVFVNGRRVGAHRGSYDAFAFDVTPRLRRGARNELVVVVDDPGAQNAGQAVGKQFPASVAVFFTASPGIWQTVWLEAVGRSHVEQVDLEPRLDPDRVLVRPRVEGPRRGLRAVVRWREGRRVRARASGPAGATLRLAMRGAQRWTPQRPALHDLDVELRDRRGRVVDRARSYVGLREVGVARDARGIPRPTLNGRFVFQTGALDQGFWPDGIYTAPTDAALRFDLLEAKRYGFNMLRKHLKVEPQRFYHWADRLGVLLWQDMPSMSIYRPVTEAAGRQWERELREMIAEHRSSPSIVSWIPFNEGWGEFDVSRITDEVKRLDPSRLVNGHSGGVNCCAGIEPRGGDVRDSHLYNGPWAPPPDRRRISVTGEFGGLFLRAPGNEHPAAVRAAGAPGAEPTSPAAAVGLVRRQWAALEQQVRSPGLSGSVFTELYDVEQELAGLVSYDRKVRKVDPAVVRGLNRRLVARAARDAARGPQDGAVPGGASATWTFDAAPGGTVAPAAQGAPSLALEGGATIVAGRRGRGSALGVAGEGQRAASPGPVVDTGGSFTVSAWVRSDAGDRSGTAVGQGAAGSPGVSLGVLFGSQRVDSLAGYDDNPPTQQRKVGRWWTWATPGAGGCFEERCSTKANLAYDDGRFDTPVGRWAHVVGVVDRATRTSSLFIDGEPADVRVADRVWASAGPFTVGAGAAGHYPFGDRFVGAVDDVRVWPRALSAAEAWRLYRAEGGAVRTVR